MNLHIRPYVDNVEVFWTASYPLVPQTIARSVKRAVMEATDYNDSLHQSGVYDMLHDVIRAMETTQRRLDKRVGKKWWK